MDGSFAPNTTTLEEDTDVNHGIVDSVDVFDDEYRMELKDVELSQPSIVIVEDDYYDNKVNDDDEIFKIKIQE